MIAPGVAGGHVGAVDSRHAARLRQAEQLVNDKLIVPHELVEGPRVGKVAVAGRVVVERAAAGLREGGRVYAEVNAPVGQRRQHLARVTIVDRVLLAQNLIDHSHDGTS